MRRQGRGIWRKITILSVDSESEEVVLWVLCGVSWRSEKTGFGAMEEGSILFDGRYDLCRGGETDRVSGGKYSNEVLWFLREIESRSVPIDFPIGVC